MGVSTTPVPGARLIDGEWVTAEQLLEKHKPLINVIIRRYKRQRLSGVMDWDDLRSIASEALLIAFKKYDPVRDVKFTTFLHTWIKHCMGRELIGSEMMYIPRNAYTYLEQVRVNGDTHLSACEIVEKYECKPPTAKAIEQYFQYTFHALSWERTSDAGTGLLLDELIGYQPDDSALTVKEFLTGLTAEQLELLHLRSKGYTYQEIGSLKGMTRQAIYLKMNVIKAKWQAFEQGGAYRDLA